jgi:hypothetical protein
MSISSAHYTHFDGQRKAKIIIACQMKGTYKKSYSHSEWQKIEVLVKWKTKMRICLSCERQGKKIPIT